MYTRVLVPSSPVERAAATPLRGGRAARTECGTRLWSYTGADPASVSMLQEQTQRVQQIQ
jgi:hypothetical protein